LRTLTAVVVGAGLLLGACSDVSDAIWPSLDAGAPGAAPQRVAVQAAGGPPTFQAPPTLNQTDFSPPGVTGGQPTGTFVGQKVVDLRGEVRRLQGRLAEQNQQLQGVRGQTTQDAQRYQGVVAAISARLQMGTTPSNPVLVSQWNTAQGNLEQIAADVSAMNALANDVAANSSLAAYILENARAAYQLAGAIDEDHRQLAILEDETNRTVVLVDRLLNELNEDVTRQTAYISNERANLATLSAAIRNGELLGPSLLARAYAASAVSAQPGGPAAGFQVTSTPRPGYAPQGLRPLVVIRFDRPDVEYRQALYSALTQALERAPNAHVDVVAVTPTGPNAADNARNANQAKRQANDVMQKITEMGLPASRVSLAATSSPQAASNEVHVYVR
jgi:hypothetical protein